MITALTYDDVQVLPKYSDIESRSECNVRTNITKNLSLDLPIIASPMDTVCGSEMCVELSKLGALGILHRFNSIEEQVAEVKNIKKEIDYDNDPRCCRDNPTKTRFISAAVGATGDYLERTKELISAGVTLILIDVAHGHHKNVQTAIWNIKTNYDVEIVAGNVATYQGAQALIDWGADSIRCGIGGGSACTTRTNTSIGVPNISALLSCSQACKEKGIPLIADGGIRYTGDVVKAIVAGADVIMVGSLFAGTKETPGKVIPIGEWPNQDLYKNYRGSASLDIKVSTGKSEKNIEGVNKIIKYKGAVKPILNHIIDGLQSGMSYVGARNLKELKTNGEFIHITESGKNEARPHIFEK